MSTRVDVTLRGEMAERFEEIREEIEETRGYRPAKTQVVGVLIEDFDRDQ